MSNTSFERPPALRRGKPEVRKDERVERRSYFAGAERATEFHVHMMHDLSAGCKGRRLKLD